MIIGALGRGTRGTTRTDPTGGGFVEGKAPGQVEFESIVRAPPRGIFPKCATEGDLVKVMRRALSAFPSAPSSTRNTLQAAVSRPRARLQTAPGGVYCVGSKQRDQVYKAIAAAFQGHAVQIGIEDTEKKNLDELIDNLDPTSGKFWDNVWDVVRPFAIWGGAALGAVTLIKVAGAVKAIKR